MFAVTFKNVDFHYQTRYQRVPILSNYNLQIEAGEYIVIYGPSGSGKTSLLNLIAGFLRPQSGDIIVNGENISDLSEKEVCKFRNSSLGYVFQFFNLVMELSVYENISLPQIIAGVKASEIKNNLSGITESLHMDERLRHYPYELSGGEQQRVAIARALINNPDIILADEPTGNLDKDNGMEVMKMLKQINEQGKTVIVVTHDPLYKEDASRIIEM